VNSEKSIFAPGGRDSGEPSATTTQASPVPAQRPIAGYKCPKCNTRFGTDCGAFMRHLSENGDCMAIAGALLMNLN